MTKGAYDAFCPVISGSLGDQVTMGEISLSAVFRNVYSEHVMLV